ncbi:hypothetical protein UA08_08078 [Talaromyces atroroseus]|uniref:cysteine dioxygenase n=1 Tax=Talaromyces atroroseus TaxID=1441469 RepID=A0A225AC39_TALAT|nr:hypothetical protein UA08_08078 [Talaromyces atroroseus]OKL56393.1 hypothetical protein UA08_08078 [Talaromyces atroroseus]
MANALDFYDPFWESPASKREFQYEHGSFAWASMPVGTEVLAIVGQGTIAVKSNTTESVKICVKTGDSYPMLTLNITQSTVAFTKKDSDTEEATLPYTLERAEGNPYIPAATPDDGTVYWLSIDRSNCVLRYGKYYTCKALTLLEVRLNAQPGAWLEKLTSVEVHDGSSKPQIKISRLPVTMDLPPLVVTNEAVSLRQLDLAQVTTWANLPSACQNLYHNVAGKNITLESSDFKDFADAIHRSVTTPGYWGHDLLKKKCKNPINPDPEEFMYKYLRVTIGSNKGNSPGIPYVMEVWPPKHMSPIHDHGDACAVIRVLSGTIQCTWYDALIQGFEPIKLGNEVLLKKDQITWLGENQYQIHALKNTMDKTCVTLQCYEFPHDNDVHEEKFRYIDSTTKNKKNFVPNSDCTFEEFYKYIKWEWTYKGPHSKA